MWKKSSRMYLIEGRIAESSGKGEQDGILVNFVKAKALRTSMRDGTGKGIRAL